MKVVLDTNVLSELVKPRPNASVSRMILEAPFGSLFASEITRYELPGRGDGRERQSGDDSPLRLRA